jgi:ferrous iron transport protein B
MGKSTSKYIALVGNPNAGKSSLFNALTGLKQKVGNFPGITVDKKTGSFYDHSKVKHKLIDLPGIYSLSPKSFDEEVSCKVLLHKKDENKPDLIILVLDASNLKRNLFLATQILDLKIPTILALNMQDVAQKSGIQSSTEALEAFLDVPVVAINAKLNEGTENIILNLHNARISNKNFYTYQTRFTPKLEEELADLFEEKLSYSTYKQSISAHRFYWLKEKRENIKKALIKHQLDLNAEEIHEISSRYKIIGQNFEEIQKQKTIGGPLALSAKLDTVLTHQKWGYLVMIFVFFIVFQAVFTIAAYPMDWIDSGMAWFSNWISNILPEGGITDLIRGGILAGISGVVVFVPQIMILFALVAILEESGYMARVSFLNDRLLRSIGMNGKRVVPLISGFACAVPAIMAARSIENWKERLITIMITPLMSCSARLPVYIFLVGFIVPDKTIFGFISIQGLFMLGLYLIGILLSIFVALTLQYLIKTEFKSNFILEMPIYRKPIWINVLSTSWSKSLTFITEAGKIILGISIVLWFLSSYGPKEEMEKVDNFYSSYSEIELNDSVQIQWQSEKLRASYAGQMGKLIEPAILPLGYDWKIGIAIIASFAAREVFVGTMSIIYSVDGEDNSISALQDKLRTEIHPATGKPLFGLATSMSLLMFYVVALQCVSTLAIVKRETNSWKWPLIQFFAFSGIAYVLSLLTYQILV